MATSASIPVAVVGTGSGGSGGSSGVGQQGGGAISAPIAAVKVVRKRGGTKVGGGNNSTPPALEGLEKESSPTPVAESGGGAGAGTGTGAGRVLAYSLRGSETLLNEPPALPIKKTPKVLKLSLQAKPRPGGSSSNDKAAVNTAIPTTSRSARPLFFIPNYFFVFIILSGIGTTIWTLLKPSPVPTPTLDLSMIRSDEKLSQLETLLTTTTLSLQSRLDLVDARITRETESVRSELSSKIDEQAIEFTTDIRNIKADAHDIETSLAKLTLDLPSRQDVEDLIHSLLNKHTSELKESSSTQPGPPPRLGLDDVRAAAKKIIQDELEKHSADRTGRVDYALASGGGKVSEHSEIYSVGVKTDWGHHLSLGIWPAQTNTHPLASRIIEPSFGEPGKCLPLKGNRGYVTVVLRTSIYPEAISLEHVSKSVAYDISSAPKEFRVFGWLGSLKDDISGLSQPRLLGEFTYDVEKQSIQTFSVAEDGATPDKLINTVKLEVVSNYGSPSHTCLYRLRVHGSNKETAVAENLNFA